jgi:hypothetical protein
MFASDVCQRIFFSAVNEGDKQEEATDDADKNTANESHEKPKTPK